MKLDDYMERLAKELEEEVMDELVDKALYAIHSNSRDDVNECYGAAKMAYRIGAIRKPCLWRLNHALVSGWMNAGEKQREVYAETVTEEDIRAGRNWRDRQA